MKLVYAILISLCLFGCRTARKSMTLVVRDSTTTVTARPVLLHLAPDTARATHNLSSFVHIVQVAQPGQVVETRVGEGGRVRYTIRKSRTLAGPNNPGFDVEAVALPRDTIVDVHDTLTRVREKITETRVAREKSGPLAAIKQKAIMWLLILLLLALVAWRVFE